MFETVPAPPARLIPFVASPNRCLAEDLAALVDPSELSAFGLEALAYYIDWLDLASSDEECEPEPIECNGDYEISASTI